MAISWLTRWISSRLDPKTFTADRQPHAGREHLDPVGDRLGEAVAPAGHLQGRAHLLDQVVLGLLPEQELLGERLLQRRAEGRKFLRGRAPAGRACARLPNLDNSSSAAHVAAPTARSKSSQLSGLVRSWSRCSWSATRWSESRVNRVGLAKPSTSPASAAFSTGGGAGRAARADRGALPAPPAAARRP